MAREGWSFTGVTFAAAILVAAATVSCGGSKGPGPATSDTGGGGSGGGTSGGGSGSGGTGGGTTSGGGSGTDGSGGSGAGGTAGGGTSGGGTNGGGGATAGGGSGGSGGTSGGGGSGSSACATLTATFDAGRARRFALAHNEDCFRATASPNGQVALSTLAGGRGTGDVTVHLLPPNGSAEDGTISMPGNLAADVDPWLHWTSAGWAAVVNAFLSGSPYPDSTLGSFDDHGRPIARSTDSVISTAPDGHGGTVMIAQHVDPSGATRFGPPLLEWLDANGTVLRSAALDQPARPSPWELLLVDWATDHVLVLAPVTGGLQGRWYDGTGAPLTPWFSTAVAVDDATMHLLLDGTIALGDVTGWRGVFRDGVGSMDPPPAWLAARPGTRLATIRGGRGYAVLPWHDDRPGAPAQEKNALEIVTPSGESCGTLTTPAAPGEAGVTRAPEAIEVGQDGTVLESEDLSGAVLGAGNHCEFRWWPALLR